MSRSSGGLVSAVKRPSGRVNRRIDACLLMPKLEQMTLFRTSPLLWRIENFAQEVEMGGR